MRRLLIAVLLAASILLAPFAAAPTLAAILPPSHAQFEARVIELVNVERQKAGLPPLTANGPLTRAAQGYAIVLADGTCFGHACGSTLVDRALQAGYTNWLALGENIAAGHTTPEAVMAAWMASPGHRDGILGNYKDIGVGLAADATGRISWVQDFGRSQTVAVVPPPANCAPRPAFSVRSVPVSPGVLQVTVTAGTTAGAPNNTLRTIRFGSLVNAAVDVPGYGTALSNTTAGLVPGTQQVTFVVRRAGSLAGPTGTTVPFTITDDCGDWRTFIGGGRTAF